VGPDRGVDRLEPLGRRPGEGRDRPAQEICQAIVHGDENAARRAAEEHIPAAMRIYRAAH
jgi:DNA-binding FadR family transcriptional regulator